MAPVKVGKTLTTETEASQSPRSALEFLSTPTSGYDSPCDDGYYYSTSPITYEDDLLLDIQLYYGMDLESLHPDPSPGTPEVINLVDSEDEDTFTDLDPLPYGEEYPLTDEVASGPPQKGSESNPISIPSTPAREGSSESSGVSTLDGSALKRKRDDYDGYGYDYDEYDSGYDSDKENQEPEREIESPPTPCHCRHCREHHPKWVGTTLGSSPEDTTPLPERAAKKMKSEFY
ncbi:hypothetical protein M426DRAFT_259553 [Hypoxylon sp. CI-4A]|nr:hypothetical protein M426DRAFT_259553 [Hypoxylon sp. CI-4A]